jgi:molecular chaperone GrpE
MSKKQRTKAELLEETELLKKKFADSEEKYIRLLSDFQNSQKRANKNFESNLKREKGNILLKVADIKNDLSQAIDQFKCGANHASVMEGIELVAKSLEKILLEEGVEMIKSKGEPFDYRVHEAVARVEGVAEEGVVVEEIRKGYRMGEKVLRPAMVVVSSGKKGQLKKKLESD